VPGEQSTDTEDGQPFGGEEDEEHRGDAARQASVRLDSPIRSSLDPRPSLGERVAFCVGVSHAKKD
jgi:hypothetical protein